MTFTASLQPPQPPASLQSMLCPHYFDWSFNRFNILLQLLVEICATYVGVFLILVLDADRQLRYSCLRYICHPMPPFV